MSEEITEKRVGPAVKWSMSEKTGFGSRETSGYTVDNLDKKPLDEADNLFEKVFILTRGVLEQNASYCMDVESERLQCCQEIARIVQRVCSEK